MAYKMVLFLLHQNKSLKVLKRSVSYYGYLLNSKTFGGNIDIMD